MDVQFLKDWGGVFSTFMGIGAVVYTWLTVGSKNNSEQLKAVDQRLDHVEERLTKIEVVVEHLPDEKAITALKVELLEMKASFGRIEESVSGITRTVHRVEEYLLRRGTS